MDSMNQTLSARAAAPQREPRGPEAEILAFIPARSGSKGLPGKNIRDLRGKPLLAYSVEVARHAPAITRVIVSTDDEALAAAAREHGAEVPFLRPAELSGDSAVVPSAVRYTLDRLEQEEDYRPEAYVVLFPTHPFRTTTLVDELARRCREGFREVVTARPLPSRLSGFVTRDGRGRLAPLCGPKQALDLDVPLRRYGLFCGYNLLPSAQPSSWVHLVTDPVSLIDIDTLDDFLLAEEILRNGLFDFGLP